jgi:hypothetical protein
LLAAPPCFVLLADAITKAPRSSFTLAFSSPLSIGRATGRFYAPDTRIKEHAVKIASGEWTSVIGVMEATFTKPVPVGDDESIPPTGKAFKLVTCTVGHWKDGVTDEEYLFGDSQTFMKQIGVTP